MATYIILNIVVMVIVAIVLIALRMFKIDRMMMSVLVILLATTAVFDSLLIYFDIVGYNLANISGLYILKAPIEDFCYSLLVGILIPTVWNRLGDKNAKNINAS